MQLKTSKNYGKYYNEYVKLINKGRIVIGDDMVLTLILIAKRYDKYGCAQDKADKMIDWAEKNYSLGAGLIQIMLWHKVILESFYALINPKTGGRLTKTLFLMVGRGQAKTKIISMITFYELMVGDVPEKEMTVISETKALATRMYQDVAKQFTARTAPKALKYINFIRDVKRVNSSLSIRVNKEAKILKTNGSSLTVTASTYLDGGREYGINVDEIHYIKNRTILEDLRKGQQKDETGDDNWFLTVATTQGDEREGALDFELAYGENVLHGNFEDDSYLPFLYRLDSPEEVANEDMWEKANPGLGITLKYEDVRKEINKSKGDVVSFGTLLKKRFNIVYTSSSEFFNTNKFDKLKKDFEPLRDVPVIVGIDGALTGDLTALSFGTFDGSKWNFEMRAILPRASMDSVNKENLPKYEEALEKGELLLHEEEKTDGDFVFKVINDFIEERNLEPLAFAYDPAYVQDLIFALKQKYGDDKVFKMYQNGQSQHSALKKTKNLIYDGRLLFDNKFAEWNFRNVIVTTKGDKLQIVKSTYSEKIDLAMATIDVIQVFDAYRERFDERFDSVKTKQLEDMWSNLYSN
jgi:phage terminase large subunit-like protein